MAHPRRRPVADAISRELHRMDDAGIGAAAADAGIYEACDVGIARIGIRLQQAGGRHDHPGGAVAALKGFGVQKCLLNGMELRTGRQRFNRGDGAGADGSRACHAGADRVPVDEHGTRAALPFAAPETASGQTEIVAEDEEQAVTRLGVNLMLTTVHVKQISSHEAF